MSAAVMLGELLMGFLQFSRFVLKAQFWATKSGALRRVQILVWDWVHRVAISSLMSAEIGGPSKFKDIDLRGGLKSNKNETKSTTKPTFDNT